MMTDNQIKDAVRKNWDASSATFDMSPGHGIATQEEKDAWKKELSRDLPKSSLIILDIGCGTGAMGLLFAEMGHQVTGVDLSEAMLAQARKKADVRHLSIKLENGDAEHLPFSDGSFDVVVNRHLLGSLPNPETALNDWYRALKPGGTVLIIYGIWEDTSFTTRVKRGLSDGLARIFDRNRHHKLDKKFRTQLPFNGSNGGIPKETLGLFLENAGFSGISFRDIAYIREMQRIEQPWYRQLVPAQGYYLISATRRG
jgi:ubiquinone/menaquinone biosynthesis C-methylase UbiE